MATPASTTSQENESKKNLEQITFRFCSECSNMLYPKEDVDAHKLQFTCRTCQYTEEATSSCVFRNVLNNAAGETAGVTQDVGSDPTVSLINSAACYLCGCPLPVGIPSVDLDVGDKPRDAPSLADILDDLFFMDNYDLDQVDAEEEDMSIEDAQRLPGETVATS